MNNLAFQETEKFFEPEVARRTYANQFATEDDDFFDPPEYVKNRESYKWIISYNKSVDPLANQEGSLSVGTEIAESSGPVIQKDLTNSSDREAQELIFRINTTASIANRGKIAKRLVNLFQFAKEEDPDFIGIRSDSLKSFYNFLRVYRTLKCPSITLTPDNNIYASWRGGEGRVFSIHFLSDNDVRFVIFVPNKRRPHRKTRISGKTTYDMLMEIEANAYKLYDWI